MKDKQPYEQGPITGLTPELMEGYVKGTLSPRMSQKVKEFLEGHPFEAEAIEGLKSQSVDLQGELQDLEGRLSRKLSVENNRFRFSWPVAAAISLLLMSGLVIYFLMPTKPGSSEVAIKQEIVPEQPPEASIETERKSDYNSGTTGKTNAVNTNKSEDVLVETSEAKITQIQDEEEFDPSLEEIYEAENLDFDADLPVATRIETTGPIAANQSIITGPAEITMEEQVLTLQENVTVDDRSKAKKAHTPAVIEPTARNYTRSAELPMAEPPEEISDYLKKHTNYPKTAEENGVRGSVAVTFTVNENGGLEDFEIVKKLGFGCDEEAIRTLREGPSWKPAEINGIPIRSRGHIEIEFPPQ